MKKIDKYLLLALASLTTIGCSNGAATPNTIPSTDKVLVVDLHTWMPSGSSSSADLESITVTQDIADAFYEETGIKIKWFTGKSLDGETEEVSADYIKAIQNGTMPAIGFSWSEFTDRGYYLNLDEYLNTPNEFLSEEEQNLYPTWKDQFPSYLWSGKDCADAAGNIIALPLTLNPGPATGWFYNKTAFTAQGLEVPTTWNEFKSLANEVSAYPYKQTIGLTNWEVKFSIGPAFANALTNAVDTNSDGVISEMETLLGVLDHKYSPLQSENPSYYQLAQGVYQIAKDYYRNVLPDNWKTANSEPLWNNGTIMHQNGLWSMRAEKGNDATRTWKFGVFPAPLVSTDSATFLKTKGLNYAADSLSVAETIKLDDKVEYTKLSRAEKFVDMYKPTPSLYVNLMKNGIYNNKAVLNNAVKFLKFMSIPENVSAMCIDHQGVLGGVYGATPGDTLNDWLMQTFPVVPSCSWPTGYTVSNNVAMNKAFSKWVSGTIDDNEFYTTIAKQQTDGAKVYKDSLSD